MSLAFAWEWAKSEADRQQRPHVIVEDDGDYRVIPLAEVEMAQDVDVDHIVGIYQTPSPHPYLRLVAA
ncbi:MAG: hypothetical protein HQ481_08370 [Alphaproteobacteria bacterium]|nr:hypothetical protein [Alphaproteobacteria bacterium]